jgi:hypothetical protein
MALNRSRIAIALAAIAILSTSALADQWNDRISLTFSAPVMVPGATLPAGKYVFELVNSRSNRQLVRIRSEAGNSVAAQAQAIPIKRQQVSGDAVLQFNPTDTSAPPAIKAWFYPGSQYGHEFIYPEEQARHIAERTKTVVLSVDVPGSDVEKGVLWNFDAAGQRTPWRGDEATLREWSEWNRTRAAADPDERKGATATAINADFKGTRVDLDDLEDNPQKYMGQRISVDGEVEETYGPTLFTIDEPHWGDLDGEILVYVPTPLAALVKDNDRVTISGTVKPFVRAELEREWGWLGFDPGVEAKVSLKPVLVADRVIGGDSNTALIIDSTSRMGATSSEARPTGTSGSANAITDAATLGNGGERLVGRPISLSNVRVAGNTSRSGFFVNLGDRQLYVLPAKAGTTAANGDSVAIDGVVLSMPRGIRQQLNGPANLNDDIYIYATGVRK